MQYWYYVLGIVWKELEKNIVKFTKFALSLIYANSPLPSVPHPPNIFLMVFPVTLTVLRIYQHVIKNIRAKCDIPNLPQSSSIGQKSDKCISHFQISGQPFISKNCCNSRTSHDIDDIDDDAALTNWDVIAFFPVFDQFAAIQESDSRCMVYKT